MTKWIHRLIGAVVCPEDSSLGLLKLRKKCVVLVVGEMLLLHMS